MPTRFSATPDEATLLKTYGISSLRPTKWEDEHAEGNTIDNANPNDGGQSFASSRIDPLGLGTAPPANIPDASAPSSTLTDISSPNFDPSTFLSTYYPNATYADLRIGRANLEACLEKEENREKMRGLVKEYAGCYVRVWGCNASLHEEMKASPFLSSRDGYGSLALHLSLKQSTQKANQIYLPILESAQKAERLRNVVSALERAKSWFRIGKVVWNDVREGRYEAALKAYKKGLWMLENRPSQLLPLPSDGFGTGIAAVSPSTRAGQPQASSTSAEQKLKSNSASRGGAGSIPSLPSLPPLHNPHSEDPRSTAQLRRLGAHFDRELQRELEAQRLRILEKVWSGVERAVEELRERIWEDIGKCVKYREDGYEWKEGNLVAAGAQGQIQGLGVAVKGMKIEKCIELLVDLDQSEEPVWRFLESHQEDLTRRLQGVWRAGRKAVLASVKKTRSNGHINSGPELQKADEYAEKQLYQRLVAKMRIWMRDGHEAGRISSREHTSPLDGPWKILIALVRQLCAILSNGLEVMWDVGKGVEEGKYSNVLGSSDEAARTRTSPNRKRQAKIHPIHGRKPHQHQAKHSATNVKRPHTETKKQDWDPQTSRKMILDLVWIFATITRELFGVEGQSQSGSRANSRPGSTLSFVRPNIRDRTMSFGLGAGGTSPSTPASATFPLSASSSHYQGPLESLLKDVADVTTCVEVVEGVTVLLEEVKDFVGDAKALGVSSDVDRVVDGLVESVRGAVVKIVGDIWERDSKLLARIPITLGTPAESSLPGDQYDYIELRAETTRTFEPDADELSKAASKEIARLSAFMEKMSKGLVGLLVDESSYGLLPSGMSGVDTPILPATPTTPNSAMARLVGLTGKKRSLRRRTRNTMGDDVPLLSSVPGPILPPLPSLPFPGGTPSPSPSGMSTPYRTRSMTGLSMTSASVLALSGGVVVLKSRMRALQEYIKEVGCLVGCHRSFELVGEDDVVGSDIPSGKEALEVLYRVYRLGEAVPSIAMAEAGCGENLVGWTKLSEGKEIEEGLETLKTLLSLMDTELFERYVSEKKAYIVSLVDGAVYGIDWEHIAPPSAVRPYVYTILNYLVDIHAEVYDVVDSDLIESDPLTLSNRELTTTMVNRVLASLVHSLVGAVENAFEKVERLGQGGLLLAVLELKLLHKSFAAFCSPETEERLKDVYMNRIVKVYSVTASSPVIGNETSSSSAGSQMKRGFSKPSVQEQFDKVDRLLSNARKGCAVLYLSFRVQGLRGGASSRSDVRAPARHHVPIASVGQGDKQEAKEQREVVQVTSTSPTRAKSKSRRRGLKSVALGLQSFSTGQMLPTLPSAVVTTSPHTPLAPRIDIDRPMAEMAVNKAVVEGGKQSSSVMPVGPPPPPPNPQRHHPQQRQKLVTGTHLTVPDSNLPVPPTSRRIGLPSSPRATLPTYRDDRERQLEKAGSGDITAGAANVSVLIPTRSERQLSIGRKPPSEADPMGLDDVHVGVKSENGGPSASTRIPSPVKRNRSPRSVSNLPVPPTSRTFWKQSKRSASEVVVSGRKVDKDVPYDDDEAML